MDKIIKLITKPAIYEDVLKQIKSLIKGGTWRPGEKIPSEMTLAQEFGVSRNSIREALKAMALSGILQSRAGTGTYVRDDALIQINNSELIKLISTPSSLKEFVELMQVRLLLECETAFLAAQNSTPEDIEELENIVKDQIKNKKIQKDLHSDKNLRLQVQFHEKIATIAGNRVILKLLRSLRAEIFNQRHAYIVLPLDRWDIMFEEHLEITHLIAIHDGENAKKAMEEHLLLGMKTVKEMLKKDPEN